MDEMFDVFEGNADPASASEDERVQTKKSTRDHTKKRKADEAMNGKGAAETQTENATEDAEMGETSEALSRDEEAEQEVERAFFEKSMVGQLYFPDEHKIAVYLPLLGPISVPLIMGLITELKNWIARRKQRAQDAKGKKTQ
ncbi:hypothetical protein NQ176_g2451 [Zarea fungicola]|uniref:Uncharacterized protein n=1 Tax=Zarea fungicola TaxID=93591 RepID=A0ACC1NN90_9HYPO|nr:hypothetical protein NQ176_g2451 [Lecanicillium fungicola]